ncbi:casein kinase 1 [Angomonas deanei]|uniref:non-specific serine/threonine protein kinase n=1 Tax=Angomonas deanei TaxID=59799 RepID=S9WD02_9TRYP|nr:casein kinase 1 [Angomonas deanei]EPY33960.1 casein kinase 1 [Angomonas deanei]CAD2217913.1 Protein kinase domain/Protein tyrosine kinase/Fungal protein kinase, putative [Angomonas deanei]|eukprot:EPY30425.1 casein kinase 1 [Angomonas deanei]
MSRNKKKNDILIAGRFKIEERLGGGAFGEVFKGVDVVTGVPVAMKMELTKDGPRSHLNLEHKIYHRFNECPVTIGVPRSYFCGKVGDYTVMVMDLLGPCLEDLFNACDRNFGTKTVCMMGIQIIQRIQYLHSVGYLHRDIKPENFVMGINEFSHVVYVIDVGLSKAWRDYSGKHVPFSDGKSLTGTARYVSINTHEGFQQSRRDDLEAVSYLIMYFLRGSLPWQGLKAMKNDVRYERIRDVKKATSPEELAKDFAPEFGELVAYARGLQFEEEPDYAYCVGLLKKVLNDKRESMDYNYAWNDLRSPDHIRKSSTNEAVQGTSQHQTAVANAGNSQMMSSVFLEGSKFHSEANSNHYLKEMEDAYGLGDFY